MKKLKSCEGKDLLISFVEVEQHVQSVYFHTKYGCELFYVKKTCKLITLVL